MSFSSHQSLYISWHATIFVFQEGRLVHLLVLPSPPCRLPDVLIIPLPKAYRTTEATSKKGLEGRNCGMREEGVCLLVCMIKTVVV